MNFYEEIAEYELEVREDYNESMTPVFFLHEIDDPSVGIFGSEVSPSFVSFAELEDWWNKNKEEIKKKYGD